MVIIAVSCASYRKEISNKLEAKITNKFVKDSLDIEIEITNNTSKNYYLQFDISKLYNPITFFSSEYLHNIDLKLQSNNDNRIVYDIVNYECYYPENTNAIKISKFVKNVFKIKSGEKIKFKIPFLMKTKVNDYCWYGYQKEFMSKKNKYFVCFEYKMYSETDKDIIPLSTKDSLKHMGYEFYDKEIISNKVPLKW
jgi:hypothetical protein